MNRITMLILLILLVLGGLWVYGKMHTAGSLGSGAVTAKDGTAVDSDPSQGNGGGAVSNQPPDNHRAAVEQDGQVANPSSTDPVIIQSPTAAPNRPAALPASDTVAPNPPNGLAFGGTGRYQWYRQGNLTWRVDTNSGEACVAFATMHEWSNPIVYSHGCGNS